MRSLYLVGAGMVLGALVSLLAVWAPMVLQQASEAGVSISVPALMAASGISTVESELKHISLLEAQVEQLKVEIAMEQAARGANTAATAATAPSPVDVLKHDNTVTIDLFKLLGLTSFYAGVAWDPVGCMPPYKVVWPNITDEESKLAVGRLAAEMRAALAEIKGVDAESINILKPFAEAFGDEFESEASLPTDPTFKRWRARILTVMLPYMPRGPDRAMIMHDYCDNLKGKVFQPSDMGTPATRCDPPWSDDEVIELWGFYSLPYDSIYAMAQQFVAIGTCSSQTRNKRPSYGDWLRMERIFNDEWHTFAVDNPHHDAALVLFDVLYEKLAVFTKQYWLGVIMMQNPFDMYSIQDIIFTVRPDVVIETGTANGGSALLWASVMHLSDMDTSKVVTLDVTAPSWQQGEASWGGHARNDPTQHSLWKKHVTFIQGDTLEHETIKRIKDITGSKTVMVLLDSHHTEDHVSKEMEVYCPMVTAGSYCIVEDTKLSRWSSTGPLESVKKYIAKHPEFEMDRSRELLYTQHAMGFLKRK